MRSEIVLLVALFIVLALCVRVIYLGAVSRSRVRFSPLVGVRTFSKRTGRTRDGTARINDEAPIAGHA